jgi:hypothetical protein
MNRADRRREGKRLRGKNIFFDKGTERPDKKNDQFCHRHRLNLEDIDHPTERDKRLIASVTYEIKKQPQDDGTIRVFKQCPRCFSIVELDPIEPPLLL